MPITNLTVEDSSPWITYNGNWGDSDIGTENYSGGTFHFTSDLTANAVITFNGTGIWLVGAKRQNHGLYGVSLDGNSVGTYQGTTPDAAGDFNFTLYPSGKLDQRQHKVVLQNVEPKFLDLDYAILQVGDGNANTKSTNFTMDDTHPNVTYSSQWNPISNEFSPQYFNSTFHASNAANTAATINFYGNAIGLYGATSNNHATYSVSIDGAPASTFNGSSIKATFRPRQMLYYVSNLPIGMHTATLTNLQDTFFTDFDYAIVETYETAASSPPGTSAGDTGGSSGSKSSSSGGGSDTPIGPIVGGIIGGLVLLGIIAFLLFLIYRQRRRNADDAASYTRKGQDALGSELAPGVSVAAMASYGGLRGPSPQRSYDNFPAQNAAGPSNGLGYSPGAAAGMAGAVGSMHSGRSPMTSKYGQAAYANGGSSPNEFIAGGARTGGAPEMDMPPPDYDRVFSPTGSSVSGSHPAPESSVGGSSAYGGYGAGPASSVTSASGSRMGPRGGVMGGLPPPNPAETTVYRQLQEKGIPIPANRDVGVNRMA